MYIVVFIAVIFMQDGTYKARAVTYPTLDACNKVGETFAAQVREVWDGLEIKNAAWRCEAVSIGGRPA